jgi:hypothetical protein
MRRNIWKISAHIAAHVFKGRTPQPPQQLAPG